MANSVGLYDQGSSTSIFNGMDVDSTSGMGGEDWAQDETLFLSSPPRPSSGLHLPSPSGRPGPLATNHHSHNHNHNGLHNNTNSSPGPTATAGGGSASASGPTPSPVTPTAVRLTSPIGTSARQVSAKEESAGRPPQTVSARTKEREELNNGLLMFRNPLSIATIVVRGREFAVHADLLCRHSDYFKRALRGGFAEAQTQRIVLSSDDGDGDHDMTAEDFGLWVDLLYRWHFHKPDTFVLRKEETGGTLSTKQILTLWQLSDRFLHLPLAALAEESLQHRLSLYSAEQWRKLYRTRPSSDIRSRVGRLQDAYRFCAEQGLPFADAVVAACANCPAQVYADCVDLLDADFMALVSRRMILAHADGSLVSKEQRASVAGGAASATATSSSAMVTEALQRLGAGVK